MFQFETRDCLAVVENVCLGSCRRSHQPQPTNQQTILSHQSGKPPERSLLGSSTFEKCTRLASESWTRMDTETTLGWLGCHEPQISLWRVFILVTYFKFLKVKNKHPLNNWNKIQLNSKKNCSAKNLFLALFIVLFQQQGQKIIPDNEQTLTTDAWGQNRGWSGCGGQVSRQTVGPAGGWDGLTVGWMK